MNDKPVSLATAANLVEYLCDKFGLDPQYLKNDLESFHGYLKEQIDTGCVELSDAVDRRIRFKYYLDGAIPEAKSVRDMWAARARMLDRALEWWKEDTRGLLQAKPDVQFEGELGVLRLQKNSNPALKIDLSTENKTVYNALSDEEINFAGIHPRFLKTMTFTVLDTEEVKKALESGAEIPWASLEQGHHARVGTSTNVRKSTRSKRSAIPSTSPPRVGDDEGNGHDASRDGLPS